MSGASPVNDVGESPMPPHASNDILRGALGEESRSWQEYVRMMNTILRTI